jgi:mannose-6-phosphate isomerase
MIKIYPMIFKPVLKHYLWGGRNLQKLGRDLPKDKQVAESWEIAGHDDGMTPVKNGFYAGKTLNQLLEILGLDLVGDNNQWALERGKFPLLVKLLDAERRLSVQVHPDDDYAQKNEGNELGKAEMWVILWAKTGAEIIYGFSEEISPATFQQAVWSGSVDRYLNHIPVKTGDHVCVPPGTLHAILEGVLLAEIQQNSNTTYRVYDWNRTDKDGQPRPLHVEKALDVINFRQIDVTLSEPCIIKKTEQIRHERLCYNAYFTTERLTFNQESEYVGTCDRSSLEIWGILAGRAVIAGELVEEVQFCLLPAGMGKYLIQADQGSVLLRAYTCSV